MLINEEISSLVLAILELCLSVDISGWVHECEGAGVFALVRECVHACVRGCVRADVRE